jgi:putative cardiolipin synthase
VLTNSLAANNHIAVHSGYATYRKKIIDAGVELYEIRANAGREVQGDGEKNADGPETLTLHTKLILIDRRYLFVGSLNLDPRSIEINAEMGLLIDAPDLVVQMAEALDDTIPKVSYRVVRSKQGWLEWHGNIDGQKTIELSEPLTSDWRRFKAWILKLVPDSQL